VTEDHHDWDVIIIGSGIGGMSAGAALARMGQRVLLLEKHTTLGGLTHSFSRDGFTWDVGIHYLSGVAPEDHVRQLLDWMADTPIEFVSLGSVYDTLHIGTAEPLNLSRPYEAQERDLLDRFPDQAEAIKAWTHALREGREAMLKILPTRAMPELAANFLDWWNRGAISKWCARTTKEVIDDLTDDPELAAVMAAQWGDHGGQPSKASFAMHALIAGAYLPSGSWYPVGGSEVLAEHLVPTITKNGGEARSGVKVSELIIEDGPAVGVRTVDGDEFRAKTIVSNIGARETVDTLLPPDCGHNDWIAEIRALPSAIAHFTLFLGFEGDIEDAGATKANHWIFPEGDTDAIWTDAPDGTPPCMMASFGSLKNPAHDPGPHNRHSGQFLVWADWDTVALWATGAPQGDYADFKARAEANLLAQFERYFPDLAKLIVFHDLGTPLSTVAFTGHHHGAFYGLDGTPDRVLSDALQARTPIPGLFLSGQDVATPGIPGALWGGLLAAACIEPKVLPKFRL
jgi:phytoene dehydrogenase-like protein